MTVGLVLAGVAAAIDWWSVKNGRREIETIAKPLVMVGLIVAALAIDADPASARIWIVGGLAFGLIGDVCLLPQVDRFIEGLGAFLVGHVLYAVALVQMYDGIVPLAIGTVIAGVIVAMMAIPIFRAVRGGKLQIPVTLYMCAVAGVAVLGFATARWPLALGALLFALSDGLLGTDRFVTPAPNRRVVVHMLYHLGQAGLVIGVHDYFA